MENKKEPPSAEEKLDIILTWYKGYYEVLNSSSLSFAYRANESGVRIIVTGSNDLNKYNVWIRQLKDDGYLTVDDGGITIITVKGLIFQGYRIAKNEENFRKKAAQEMSDRMEKNAERLNLYTKLLAIGSFALVLWEMRHLFLRLILSF